MGIEGGEERRVELLDYARFMAALSVVAFHYLFKSIQEGRTPKLTYLPVVGSMAQYGYLGVELFFMISGYVIFYSARNKTVGEFAASRALRLYPAFWAAVIFTSALSFLVPGDGFQVTAPQVLANLTMVPGVFGFDLVDGVYWTLAYELKFYILIGAMLFLGLRRHLETFFVLWPIAMLAALITGFDGILYLGEFYPFFAAGALFAMVREKTTLWYIGSIGICLLLCIEATLRQGAAMTAAQGVIYSPIILAAVIIVFFGFFISLTRPSAYTLKLPYSRLAGGLTYPLYLTHFVLGMVIISRFATQSTAPVVYGGTLCLALLVAYLLHSLVERRMAARWRHLFTWGVRNPLDLLQSRLVISRLRTNFWPSKLGR